MSRFEVGDVDVVYGMEGTGDPVVLVHASPFTEWYAPLVPHLSGFAVVRYRRTLRPQGADGYRALSVAEDAAICARLMDEVGWDSADIVGHSYGALVALGLAVAEPSRVHSLALLEPAARGIRSADQVVAALQPVFTAYRAGDKALAVDLFLRTVCGDGYRPVLDRALPDAFDDAVDHVDLFFLAEMPAVQQFSFGAADASRVHQPVLNVVGADSVQRFVEGAELVQSWFPDAERFVVPSVGHLLMVQEPAAVAAGLAAFLARHPF